MKVVKTKTEFQLMKDELNQKLDDVIQSYDKFLKSISPSQWRGTGTHFRNLSDLRDDIKYFKPLTDKDLENEWVRDEVLTDEEKELYNNSKKYNL